MVIGYKTRRQYRVENAQLRAKIDELVRDRDVDSLTGLGSGTKLYRELGEAVRRGLGFDYNVSVIFADLDDLHNLNRRTSQEFVDREIFTTVANRLMEVVEGVQHRSTDLFRRSGDEFIGIIENAGPESARILVERMNVAIEMDGLLAEYGVKVSFGVADMWEVIMNADTARLKDDHVSLIATMLNNAEGKMKVKKGEKDPNRSLAAP